MGLILVGVLICGCITAAAAAPTCGIKGEMANTTGSSFSVSLECLSSGLGATWKIQNEGPLPIAHIVELNYICRGTQGNAVTEYYDKRWIESDPDAKNGTLETSMNLTANVQRNGGKCSVYGCHQQIIGGTSRLVFYYHNESCQYPATGPSTVDAISPTSTSAQNSAITTYIELTPSTSPTSSEMIATSSEMAATSSEMIATSSEMTATSSEMIATSSEMTATSSEMTATSSEMTATSTSWYSSNITPTPLSESSPSGTLEATSVFASVWQETRATEKTLQGSNATIVITVVIVVILAFFILATPIIIGVYYCKKKKIQMNPRFKNLGIALHVDSEKIDPYYVPIEVDSLYISKCESMGSILEYLTPDHLGKKQIFKLPAETTSISTQQSKDAREQVVPFMLHPPPLKLQQECFNMSETKSQESESDCLSSNTFIATGETLQHLHEAEFESDDSLLSVTLDNGTIACSNQLFEHKLCRTGSYDCCSSQSVQTFDDESQGHHSNIYEDSHCEPGEAQDNRIILTFSSSQSYSNENVIIIEPESDTLSLDRTQDKLQQSLPATNLTINPRHFDPL